jgi:integrase
VGGSLTQNVAVRPRGPAYRLDDVSSVLGIEAPPVDRQDSPAVWVGDRLHNEATTWLEHRQASLRNDRTVSTNANRLVGWIRFLGSRGQTVHTAREDDYRAYEARCRFPTVDDHGDLTPVSAAWWKATKSVIKQFHEWLAATYGSPLPFEIVDKRGRDGLITRGIPDAGRLSQARPDVLPLMPDAVDAIVAAAGRSTPSGQERGQRRRDVGLIQWLVGTGMRITPALHLTTYEVPPRSGGDFDWLHTPAAINKYRRAVRSAAFAHRLEAARIYMAGDRRVTALHGRHRPANPLHIVDADVRAVTWMTCDGAKVRRNWNDVDIGHRLRLVDPDGSSPLLWLTQTGEPMSTRQAQHVVKESVKSANAADHRVPADAHPHSLRHTYATFMVVMWLRRDEALYASGQHRIHFGLVDAVRHVQRELGHTDERTTHIYTGHVPELLGLDPDRIKGKY